MYVCVRTCGCGCVSSLLHDSCSGPKHTRTKKKKIGSREFWWPGSFFMCSRFLSLFLVPSAHFRRIIWKMDVGYKTATCSRIMIFDCISRFIQKQRLLLFVTLIYYYVHKQTEMRTRKKRTLFRFHASNLICLIEAKSIMVFWWLHSLSLPLILFLAMGFHLSVPTNLWFSLFLSHSLFHFVVAVICLCFIKVCDATKI